MRTRRWGIWSEGKIAPWEEWKASPFLYFLPWRIWFESDRDTSTSKFDDVEKRWQSQHQQQQSANLRDEYGKEKRCEWKICDSLWKDLSNIKVTRYFSNNWILLSPSFNIIQLLTFSLLVSNHFSLFFSILSAFSTMYILLLSLCSPLNVLEKWERDISIWWEMLRDVPETL